MAEIGGFISILLMVIGLLVSKYQELDFKSIVMRDMYSWKRRVFQNEENIDVSSFSNSNI
jgi:hypothetical protein